MTVLIGKLASLADAVVCVGFTAVDEAKTSPKLNPFTGKNSYFFNKRIEQFNAAFAEAAKLYEQSVTFIDLAGQVGTFGRRNT